MSPVPHLELRERVLEANREILQAGLVVLQFGNVSEIDRAAGLMAIKPSGIPYEQLSAEAIVLVDLESGEAVEGGLRPSSDTPTHLVLYRRFAGIGAVVHTHSTFATAWAQARLTIPCLGTTHADHFDGPVPVTRDLSGGEIDGAYEAETGAVICETFERGGLDPLAIPAVLVASHGPFTWGLDAGAAVENAVALEAVAAMAYRTRSLHPDAVAIGDALRGRHFRRKHGPGAYYGQGL